MAIVTEESRLTGPRLLSSRGTVLMLAVVTVGLGLNLKAWILLGSHLHQRFDVRPGAYVAFVGVPLLVAALVRLPVGVLTDRYGARVMFPAVSLAAAAAVFGVGVGGSVPVVVGAGSAAGVAGSSFVVAAAVVSRTFRYGRRGLALGVVSLGPAVAVVVSALSHGADPGARRSAVVLGGLLVGFAGWIHALAVTGVVVGLAAMARLVGGWRADRRPTARLLMVCYAIAAVLCLVAAAGPQRGWLIAPVIAAVAVCDGVASGALLALIGKAARADSVGAVMGVSGAAAALGALVPPVLLAGADRLSHSYSAAWILLAAALSAVALYVRAHGLRIGLGLAVRFEPEPSPTAMTVALVGEAETRLGAAAVVGRLAELAVSDELVVVYGSAPRPRLGLGAHILAAGLRDRLPRHRVVCLPVAFPRGAAVLGEFVDAGAVPIAVSSTAQLHDVAAELSSYLRADRVLKVSYTHTDGADLHQVWNREPKAL
jgi:NNP family nitrate/nitrite transporter-like MFS transporter